MAELPQGDLSYRAAGPHSSSRPPVVFVHGLLVDARLWEPVAERLAASGLPWDFRWRQGLIARELTAAAQEVQAARPDDVVVILVGSSSSAMHRMVGSVAVQLAHHAPVPVTIVP